MSRYVCGSCGSVAVEPGPCARDRTERVETDDALIGEEVGGYRIVGVLGEGGMGRVYKAVLPSIGAEVAVKVLSHRLAGVPDLAERFVAEARTANLVRHDGLVNVIGAGLLPDRRPYQIMELLHGAPLVRLLERGRPALGAACNAIREALRAVAALHARGIVHRDLTPSNLFVTTTGRIKIIDFGIAKVLAATAITETGVTMGTPRYMAPEQAAGQPVDHRADLYALGIVLCECATGSRPDAGSAPATGTALLDDVIRTAIDDDPARRYANAIEMETALAAVTDALPADAFAPPLLPDTDPEAPRRIGKYEIQAVIGRGGGGVVMVGRDPDLKRRVAIKLLHASKERDERLVAEAQAMARIAHPNVIAVYEVGMSEDRVFLVMEYVEGADLSRWLETRRPWREIVAMFVEAGRGLAAVHAAGVTHRDFKPSNVVIGKDGRPRVGDFGLAHDHGTVATGGTHAYMAPEQRETNTSDALSDQFAYCASLWEALHGALPDRSRATVRVDGEPVREVPRAVDVVIERGLGERTARFPAMTDLLAGLEATLIVRDRRSLLIGGLAVAVAATAIAIVAVAVTRSTPAPAPHPGSLAEARAATSPGDVLRALGRLDPATRATDEARALAADAAVRGPTALVVQPSPATIALSDDGTHLAIATATDIAVYTNGVAIRHPSPGDVHALAFDGDRLIALVPDGLVAVPGIALVRCPSNALEAPAHGSSDLRYVLCHGFGDQIFDREQPARPVLELAQPMDLAFDSTSGRLVASNADHVVVHDTRAGVERARYQLRGGDPASRPRVVLAGDNIVIASGHELRIEDVVAGTSHAATADFTIQNVVASGGIQPSPIAWSAEGALGVWTGGRTLYMPAAIAPFATLAVPRARPSRLVVQRPHEIAIVDLDTGRELALQIDTSSVAMSADGSVIAVASSAQVAFWYPDLRPPRATQIPPSFNNIAVSRDGNTIAYCDGDGVIAGDKRLEIDAPCMHVELAGDTLAVSDTLHGVWVSRAGGPLNKIGTATGGIARIVLDGSWIGVLDSQATIHSPTGGTTTCGDLPTVAVGGPIVVLHADKQTSICELASGRMRDLAPTNPRATWRASANGASVAQIGDERLSVFGRDAKTVVYPDVDRVEDAAFDGLGVRIAVVRRGVGIVVLAPGNAPPITLTGSAKPRAFAISDDGARVAALIDGKVLLWEVAHPAAPRELGRVAAKALLRFALGADAVITISNGLTLGSGQHAGVVANRWSFALPTTGEVDAWIQRVAPR